MHDRLFGKKSCTVGQTAQELRGKSVNTGGGCANSNRPQSCQQLLENARRETGLHEFGEGFLDPFQKLIRSAEEDVAFTPLGKTGFEADIHRILVNRLRFQEDLKKHPGILDEDVSDPIIILGLPRTGTSKLQRMLSAVPGVQKAYFWRLLNPAPFPDADPSQPDPRIAAAEEAAGIMAEVAPDMVAAHSMIADEVDEEFHLHGFHSESFVHCLYTPLESYYQWVKDRGMKSAYQYMVNTLKYLQWQDGGKRGRPWVLKSPFHIGYFDTMISMYPKSTLIHSHRDVCDVVPSFCRLIESSWRVKTDRVDLDALGHMILEFWGALMDRYLVQRQQLSTSVDILDIGYHVVTRNPLPLMREILERAGIEYTEEREKAMLQWQENNPQDRYGRNLYSMERYGLNRETIERRFGGYLDAWGEFTG